MGAPRKAASHASGCRRSETCIDQVIARARFRRMFPAAVPTRAEEFEAWYRHGYRALDVLERHLAQHSFLVNDRYSVAAWRSTPMLTGLKRVASRWTDTPLCNDGVGAWKQRPDTSRSTPAGRDSAGVPRL